MESEMSDLVAGNRSYGVQTPSLNAIKLLNNLPAISLKKVSKVKDDKVEIVAHHCIKCEVILARIAIYDETVASHFKTESTLLCCKCLAGKNEVIVKSHFTSTVKVDDKLKPAASIAEMKSEPADGMPATFRPSIENVYSVKVPVVRPRVNWEIQHGKPKHVQFDKPRRNINNNITPYKMRQPLAKPIFNNVDPNFRIVGGLRLRCKRCRETFSHDEQSLDEHRKICFEGFGYKCTICRAKRPLKIPSRSQFEAHLQTNHNISEKKAASMDLTKNLVKFF